MVVVVLSKLYLHIGCPTASTFVSIVVDTQRPTDSTVVESARRNCKRQRWFIFQHNKKLTNEYKQYLYSSQLPLARPITFALGLGVGVHLYYLTFFTWIYRMGSYRFLQTPKQGGNLGRVVKKLGSIDRKVREVRVQRDREPSDRSCAVSARICLEAASLRCYTLSLVQLLG